MAKPLPLPVWDRKTGCLCQEFMDDHPSTYESKPRRSVTQWLESEPFYDWLLALYQNTKRSARRIEPFIQQHHIDMSEFKPVAYRSFAEFYDREFLPNARPFVSASDEMAAFAEARYFGWDKIDPQQEFPIKGYSLNAQQVLGGAERAAPFSGGSVISGRLSPMDYHHVHYPDDGTTVGKAKLGRSLWTVQWHALQHQPDILLRNERQIHLLETRHFGRLAFVEVGAMSVGRIVQIHPLDQPYERGDEKSAFKFGGSAAIIFGEAGGRRTIFFNIPETTSKS
ncbi:MAG: phosphatidylserine decarboxylase [Xanthobacteraceae bacterium]